METVLSQRFLWHLLVARMLTDPVWYFYQFWLPKYLHSARGLNQMDLSILWTIFLAADLGFLLSGFLSGYLIRRHVAPPTARLTILAVSALVMPNFHSHSRQGRPIRRHNLGNDRSLFPHLLASQPHLLGSGHHAQENSGNRVWAYRLRQRTRWHSHEPTCRFPCKPSFLQRLLLSYGPRTSHRAAANLESPKAGVPSLNFMPAALSKPYLAELAMSFTK
jgi:hypothetical protein